MSELDEMRENLITRLQFHRTCRSYAHPTIWTHDDDLADQILSLSTDTCRIAVVRKEGKLPKTSVIANTNWQDGYRHAKALMLSAGYVQEV